MAAPLSRLARRYAQRQVLRRGRNEAPPRDLPSQEPHRAREPRVRRNNRSDFNWNIEPSDPDLDGDFGHNSQADSDEEAKYYDEKMAQFEEEGPTLSNPGDDTREMMEKEERKWQVSVSSLSNEQVKDAYLLHQIL